MQPSKLTDDSFSPVRKSNHFNDEIKLRTDASVLLTKEESYSSLPYSSILQLPSITKNLSISYNYTNSRSPASSPNKLISSAGSGNINRVKELVSAGVSVNVIDDTHQGTPLHLACLNSASPTFKDGSSILTADRSRCGHFLVVKYLLETGGAEVNKQDGKGTYI